MTVSIDIAAVAQSIAENLGKLNAVHAAEAERVLDIGIPLAQAINREWIAALTDEGADHMIETDRALIRWVEALDANRNLTVSDWWARVFDGGN